MKLCECGCGSPAPIARQSGSLRGYVKGQPTRFVLGHANRGHIRERSANWRGGRKRSDGGYIEIRKPEHPRAGPAGYVKEHILVMEDMIGRFVVSPEEVHHIDRDRANNIPENLSLCKNNFEHKLLHRWMEAREACGHDDWRKCVYCKQWGAPETVRPHNSKKSYQATGTHPSCKRQDSQQRRAKS